MFYTEEQWQDVMLQQASEARYKMAFYDAQGESLRFAMRYHPAVKQCWSRRQREEEAEHAAISQANIPGAARGDARRSTRALYTRDPEEGRKRVLAWRQARQVASQGEATEEGEALMALMKQPAGMMKPPKIAPMKAAKPLKNAMPKAKMPKMAATLKAPKLGGKT